MTEGCYRGQPLSKSSQRLVSSCPRSYKKGKEGREQEEKYIHTPASTGYDKGMFSRPNAWLDPPSAPFRRTPRPRSHKRGKRGCVEPIIWILGNPGHDKGMFTRLNYCTGPLSVPPHPAPLPRRSRKGGKDGGLGGRGGQGRI